MYKSRLLLLLIKTCSFYFLVCTCVHAATDDILYLTATVNGQQIKTFIKAKYISDKIYVAAQDVGKLELNVASLPEKNHYFDLSSQNGLSVTFDNLNQSLTIVATKDWLERESHLASSNGSHLIRASELSPEVRGIALNYDAFISSEDGVQDTSVYNEFRTFGVGPGFFSTSLNTQESSSRNATQTGTHRLMSSWNYDNVDKLLTVRLGDSFTSAQSWTNSVRFGGISIAHNYSTQPNYNTSSQDILTDSVTLPSTVDLYVRGVRTSSQKVQPGQFTLNTAPVFTGSEGAQVVITDVNGKQRVVNLDLYGANQLLSDGLATWGMSMGWVRKDYTYRSLSYNSELMGVGDWRYGLTAKTTVGAHTEQSGDLHNQGIGWDYLLSPMLGTLHANAAVSRYAQNSGNQWGSGWQWNNQMFNFSLSHAQASRGFRDISSIADNDIATREDTLFASVSFDRTGTFGTSWVSQTFPEYTERYLGLSWSKSFDNQVNLSSSITRSLGDDRNTTLYVTFSIPLFHHQDYLSIQNNHDKEGNFVQANLSHSLESNKPGWGWNLSAQQGRNENIHASLQRRNTWSDLALGYNREEQRNSGYGSLTGAVGLFMGHLYATRELGSAFALVDTSSVADVPVYLEHRPVGHTDKNGMLFLNNLNPYQANHIEIDALGLDEDYRAPYSNEVLIPKNGRGAVARFNIYRTHAVLFMVTTADGKNVPFSAQVEVMDSRGQTPTQGTSQTIVGYDGNIYLEAPPAGGTLDIQWASSSCTLKLPTHFSASRSIERIKAQCH
ncbi:fimbria/pilus outer membrane usher protein [Leclercia sp.]|uniref:fimbria/pilus outer membrane usher protein n=1 Tax=Leclercia sp. TaxID=1898428 RepID=UPI002FDD9B0D